MFKGLRGLGSMLKNAKEISKQVQGVNDRMKKVEIKGTAGAGMVEIYCNGLFEMLRCKIDPALLDEDDPEMLEDLIVAAVNDAIEKSKEATSNVVQELAGESPLDFMSGNPDDEEDDIEDLEEASEIIIPSLDEIFDDDEEER